MELIKIIEYYLTGKIIPNKHVIGNRSEKTYKLSDFNEYSR